MITLLRASSSLSHLPSQVHSEDKHDFRGHHTLATVIDMYMPVCICLNTPSLRRSGQEYSKAEGEASARAVRHKHSRTIECKLQETRHSFIHLSIPSTLKKSLKHKKTSINIWRIHARMNERANSFRKAGSFWEEGRGPILPGLVGGGKAFGSYSRAVDSYRRILKEEWCGVTYVFEIILWLLCEEWITGWSKNESKESSFLRLLRLDRWKPGRLGKEQWPEGS